MSIHELTHIPQLTLGWRLRMALSDSTHSRASLATELGYSESQLTRWMGDHGAPRPAVLRQWAAACGVSASWLRTGDGSTDPTGGGSHQVKASTNRYAALSRTTHLAAAA